MKKGWRQTAFCRSGNKNLPLRHPNGRGALLRLVPAILAILAAIILPSPAVCGDNPSAVTESSRTYKDSVCNFMVKDLENEIAETTTSLKNCGTQSSLSPKAAAARAKECEQYERKLKLTRENLLRVKEQCDKGLTPGYLPRVIENPGAIPCAQCEANKPLPREVPAKVLTGLPVSGKVLDLKAGDPNLKTVFGKSAAAPAPAAAGVPPPGEPYVDCVCPDGRSLGWMYLSECTVRRATGCGTGQPPVVQPPPIVQPPVEPPPVVVPPTEPPPSTTQPPAKKSGLLAKVGNFFTAIGQWIWNNVLKPIVNWVKSLFQKQESDEERAQREINEWKERSKGLPTAFMVCDGKGGFRPQLNRYADAPYGVADCTRTHEETHIKDFKGSEEYKNWCIAPDGTNKLDGTIVEIPISPFGNKTECNAATAGAACLKNKSANATTAAEKIFLTEQLNEEMERQMKFCVW